MPLPEIVRVPLPPTVAEAVRALAHAELRDPPRQAAWLVAEALRQRGALPPEPAALGTRAPEGGREAAP
jgi:hypothetical protein